MSSLQAPLPDWANLSMDSCTSSIHQHVSDHISSRDSQAHSQASECRSRGARGSRGPRPRLFGKGKCQADACGADLTALPFYYQRNHICMEHSKCQTFHRNGAVVRYCQRCGLAHPLTDFDGTRRSCRRQLDRHNARRRRLAATARGATPAVSGSVSGWTLDAPPPLLDPALLEELPTRLDGPASSTGSGASFVASAGAGDEGVCPRAAACGEPECCSSGSQCLGGGGDRDMAGRSHAEAAPTGLVLSGRIASCRLDGHPAGLVDELDDDDAVSSAYTGLGCADPAEPCGAGDGALGGARLGAMSSADAERALAALQQGHADAYGFLVAHQLQLAGLLMAAARVVARSAATAVIHC